MLSKQKKEDDEYHLIRQRVDCVENEETIKPYTRIIQSKEEFSIVKDDNKISHVSNRTLTTIIDMVQAYIEETVLWIYEDPNVYDNSEEFNLSEPMTKYQLLTDNQSAINDQKPIINSNTIPHKKQPASYYILLVIYSILLIFGTVQFVQFILARDFTVKTYTILVLTDVITIFLTAGIGLFVALSSKHKLMALPSILSGCLIAISIAFIVLLNLKPGFANQTTFIYSFHLPFIGLNIAHLIANVSFEEYHRQSLKDNRLLADNC